MADRSGVASTDSIDCTASVRRIGDRAIVRLSDAASAQLPARGQVAVTATIDGNAVDTVVEPDGRRGHWLSLDEQVWRNLALNDGDEVALRLQLAGSWPEPDLPEDFDAALADAPDLADVWEDITPMARWEWVRWVNATRNPQTRERRIEVSVAKLRSGKRRPCCFDLASCTDPELSKNGKLVTPA